MGGASRHLEGQAPHSDPIIANTANAPVSQSESSTTKCYTANEAHTGLFFFFLHKCVLIAC